MISSVLFIIPTSFTTAPFNIMLTRGEPGKAVLWKGESVIVAGVKTNNRAILSAGLLSTSSEPGRQDE
jgi:hypothetical protein